MKWYIVRHAEKEKGDYYNPILHHQDEPISLQGHTETQQLWTYFCGKPIARIYVSQYLRTGQTIEYVANKIGLSPITDERLNEIDNGALEGLTDQQVQQKFPEIWKAFKEKNHDFQFPDGESGEAALRRIKSFIKEKQESKEDILIVSHEGLIRLFLCHILRLPVYQRWDFRVDFCGIMELEYQPDDGNWKLIRFNQKVI
jgi:broad specificity phosphatase PhoE